MADANTSITQNFLMSVTTHTFSLSLSPLRSESGSYLHSNRDLDHKSVDTKQQQQQQGGVAKGGQDPESIIATNEYLTSKSAPVDSRSRTGSAADCELASCTLYYSQLLS